MSATRTDAGRPVVERSVCFGDLWHGVEALYPDGSRAFWLIHHDAPDDGGTTWFFAPHERTGPLNAEWLRKVGRQCTAIAATTGQRCRRAVDTFGGRCKSHGGPS